MVPKINRGAGFRGVLNYVLRAMAELSADQQPRVIAGNMDLGDARALAAQFRAARALRPDIKKPVWHCPLSLQQGEHVDDMKFAEVLKDFVRHMGFTDLHPWVAVLHQDKKHLHAHIVACRIALDGSVWTGEHEARRAIAACRRLEEKHGLRPTVPKPEEPSIADAERPKRTTLRDQALKAKRRAERHSTKANDVHALRLAALEAIDRAATVEELQQQLAARGVEVEFARRGEHAEIYGWKLRQPGADEWLKASSVSRDITWPRVTAALGRHADLRARAQAAAKTVKQRAVERAAEIAAKLAEPAKRSVSRPRSPLPPAAVELLHDPLSFMNPAPHSPLESFQPPAHLDDVPLRVQPSPPPNELLKMTLSRLKAQDLERLRELAERKRQLTGDEALIALLRRLLDLALRVLSLGTVGLPPTMAEREDAARDHLIQQIDVELALRSERARAKVDEESLRMSASAAVRKTFDPRTSRRSSELQDETDDQDEQGHERNRRP
jgi:hypothetical protein